MNTFSALAVRNTKLFFKDKGMFFTSLITPIILLVLYGTFLANIFKIILTGTRGEDIILDAGRMDDVGNILEIVDETSPAYDFERLYAEHADTILGRYIGRFRGCREGSTEYEALCEGVEALLESRRQ